MGFAQVDNGPMDLLSPWRRWARPAVVALALAALTAVPAPPALAAPEPSGPEALAAARAEAARLQREVDKLDDRVETLAEAHSAAQVRLDGLIQATHRHQEELERSELAVPAGVAGHVLDRDVRALASVGLATGTVRAKVTELAATQAETLALRERLAGHEAAIARLLAERKAMLATARAQLRAEQARQEAARRAMVAA